MPSPAPPRRRGPCSRAPDEPRPTAATSSFATLHGLYWLALNLAESQPLLLAVDDLHWVDRPSLRFLAYVLRRVEGVPILFAAGLRSAEAGTDPALLAEIVHDPATVQVHPARSAWTAIEAMVVERARRPSPSRASATPATRRPAATRCSCASS